MEWPLVNFPLFPSTGCDVEGANSTTCNVTDTPFLGYPLATQCILGTLMVVMLVLSVCGNGVVCILVYRDAAMRSAINLKLASMAMSNALLGALCMPPDLLTLAFGAWVLGPITCCIHAFFFSFLSLVSVLILLLISVDRYVILVRRRDKMSARAAKILLGVTWSISALLNVNFLFNWPDFLPFTGQTHGELEFAATPGEYAYVCIQFALSCFLPVLLMLYCYFSILFRVHQDGARVAQAQQHENPPAATKRSSLATLARSRLFLHVDTRFKTRTFATILVVFLSFCIFRLPYTVCMFVRNLERRAPSGGYPYLVWWYYLNATFNPLIYAWRIRKFRAACLELFPVLGTCFRPFAVKQEQQFRPRPSAIYQMPEPSYFTPSSSQPSIEVQDDDDDDDDF